MKSEAREQQEVRLEAAEIGGILWRNNVGARPTKEECVCPRCEFEFIIERPPLRYGLCNESHKLNEKFKSHDLIGITPRIITPRDIGIKIGQFTSWEVKKSDWKYTGTKREQAQKRWADLVTSYGGLAGFRTGRMVQV